MSNDRKHPKRPGRPGPRGGWLAPQFTKATAREAGRRGGIKSGETRRAKRAAHERDEEADRRRRDGPGSPAEEKPDTAPYRSERELYWSEPEAPPSRKIMIVSYNGTRPAEPDRNPVICDPWSDKEAERMAGAYRAKGYDVLVAR